MGKRVLEPTISYKRWVVEHSGYINFFDSLLEQPRGWVPISQLYDSLKSIGEIMRAREIKSHIQQCWDNWARFSHGVTSPRYSGESIKSGPTNIGNW